MSYKMNSSSVPQKTKRLALHALQGRNLITILRRELVELAMGLILNKVEIWGMAF